MLIKHVILNTGNLEKIPVTSLNTQAPETDSTILYNIKFS